MESGNHLLGVTKLVIGITSLAGSFHNKLNVPGTRSIMHFRQHFHQTGCPGANYQYLRALSYNPG
jgi:hypothetical protein